MVVSHRGAELTVLCYDNDRLDARETFDMFDPNSVECVLQYIEARIPWTS